MFLPQDMLHERQSETEGEGGGHPDTCPCPRCEGM